MHACGFSGRGSPLASFHVSNERFWGGITGVIYSKWFWSARPAVSEKRSVLACCKLFRGMLYRAPGVDISVYATCKRISQKCLRNVVKVFELICKNDMKNAVFVTIVVTWRRLLFLRILWNSMRYFWVTTDDLVFPSFDCTVIESAKPPAWHITHHTVAPPTPP
jgi:hypothetical protein